MFLLIVLLLIVVPLAELAVIIRIGDWIGFLNTIGLLILIAAVGAWLVKREGLGVWRRIRAQLNAGQVPAMDLVDAFVVLCAGVCLLAPGFITDIIGLLLLAPPTRALVRRRLRRRYQSRVQVVRSWRSPGPQPPGSQPPTPRPPALPQ